MAFTSEATNLIEPSVGDASDFQVYLRVRGTPAVTLVSATPDGSPGNAGSEIPALNADGSVVAFYSSASDLAANDANGRSDVFVYNAKAGRLTLISRTLGGASGNNASSLPSISADGRYVAFTSYASDLVAGDTNGKADIFVFDRRERVLQRASVSADGEEGNGDSSTPAISADGRFVAFTSASTTWSPRAPCRPRISIVTILLRGERPCVGRSSGEPGDDWM